MCHICAKEFWDSNFNQAVIDKISDFHEIAPNITNSQKSQYFKDNGKNIGQLLPYKVLWQGHLMYQSLLFFIFVSCEPLNNHTHICK